MAASVRVDGSRVKDMRMRKGYDQGAVAGILGISRVGLWKIEKTGRTSPETRRKLVLLLGDSIKVSEPADPEPERIVA